MLWIRFVPESSAGIIFLRYCCKRACSCGILVYYRYIVYIYCQDTPYLYNSAEGKTVFQVCAGRSVRPLQCKGLLSATGRVFLGVSCMCGDGVAGDVLSVQRVYG